ncbi:hypothetical protein Cni_G13675 [Canna indica]|uniref:Uncharacterized protein n=1 Tax=Canna indica TaxID=4628 RepID=A0AAQ3KEV5_9LILI|nr:hypothetical protein Cni_G13675 [Canna indica]
MKLKKVEEGKGFRVLTTYLLWREAITDLFWRKAESGEKKEKRWVTFCAERSRGYLLSRVIEYSTIVATSMQHTLPPAKTPVGPSGKITDEFTSVGAIGRVCQVIDVVIDVRFDEGLPLILMVQRCSTTRSDWSSRSRST